MTLAAVNTAYASHDTDFIDDKYPLGVLDSNIYDSCWDKQKQYMFKISDGSKACVFPSSVEKLVERNWGTYDSHIPMMLLIEPRYCLNSPCPTPAEPHITSYDKTVSSELYEDLMERYFYDWPLKNKDAAMCQPMRDNLDYFCTLMLNDNKFIFNVGGTKLNFTNYFTITEK